MIEAGVDQAVLSHDVDLVAGIIVVIGLAVFGSEA